MPKVVEIKDRLNSITKVNKMTQAMQVVAIAQLKKLQSRQRAAWHFRKHYDRLAKRLDINIVRKTNKVNPVVLIYAFGSEKGFCGCFNEDLLSEISGFIKNVKNRGKEVKIKVIGSKACDTAKNKCLPDVEEWVGDKKDIGFSQIEENALKAYELYEKGEVEEVYLFFNEFKSVLVQNPLFFRVLPFDLSKISASPADHVFEPSLAHVKEFVGINYLKVLFYDVYMQSQLGEVASRLMTMRSATENSKEMINSLNIKLNKARQAMITYELSEILSSFEILTEGEN